MIWNLRCERAITFASGGLGGNPELFHSHWQAVGVLSTEKSKTDGFTTMNTCIQPDKILRATDFVTLSRLETTSTDDRLQSIERYMTHWHAVGKPR